MEQLPENQKDQRYSDKARSFIAETVAYIKQLINLEEDKADPHQSIRDIERSVVFRGTNVWILMFSILVASLGLNINSTAVIIGAMLISPLLGPIMGVGLGIGINNFDLIKKSLKNLLVMVGVSITASTLYFALSPLSDAQSELLARTTPTIFDVGVAFFGGLAGIVALSRTEKSTVIPGVAIATALMPPLCTAGYGLGTLQFNFFLGAMYLFFINSVFICLATVIIVRYLKYPQKVFVDKQREKRVKTYITIVVILTILPSIYIAYGVVSKSIFLRNAQNFVLEYFDFENTRIINRVIEYNGRDSSLIDLTLFGEPVDEDVMRLIRNKLADHGLKKTKLIVHQGNIFGTTMERNLIDGLNQSLRTGIMEEIFQKREQEMEQLIRSQDSVARYLEKYEDLNQKVLDISKEIAIQYPGVNSFSLSRNLRSQPGAEKVDTITNALVQIDRQVFRDRQKFEDWIKVRTKQEKLEFIYY